MTAGQDAPSPGRPAATRNRTLLRWNAAVLLGLGAAWVLYLLAGHRLIGAIYRGESLGFLNALIEGQSTHPADYYLHIADRLMRLGSVLALATAATVSVLLTYLPSSAAIPYRFTLPLMTAILGVLSLSAPAAAFFYPLEIETRESTGWLHTAALRAGVNIYDHSRVAFINMPHGPFDSLFKLLVAIALPFLEPWQVTRFAVFLLPYAFLILAWRLLRNSSLESRWHVPYLAGLGYLSLLVTAKEFFFVGRSDATAALLLLGLSYVSLVLLPKTRSTALLHGAACGTLAISTVLTNWRTGPAVFAVLVYAVFRYRTAAPATPKQIWTYLAAYSTAALTLAGLLLVSLFHGDPVLYYRHFFGFFANASGWGHSPYPESLIRFVASLFDPTSDRTDPRGGPLLLSLAFYALTSGTGLAGRRAWRLLSGFVFLSCAAAYYLNYDGGGPWYFIPFLIILWFEWCAHYPSLTPRRRALAGLCVLALVGVNARSVLFPTLHRVRTYHAASEFADLLRSIQARHTLLSEDMFFFETGYHGELIDMGDTCSQVARTGYYGVEFERTVARHFDRIAKDPPDYVVTGFTESPELRAVLETKYVLVAEGPGNLTANGDGVSSQLFRRADLPHPAEPR